MATERRSQRLPLNLDFVPHKIHCFYLTTSLFAAAVGWLSILTKYTPGVRPLMSSVVTVVVHLCCNTTLPIRSTTVTLDGWLAHSVTVPDAGLG